jgi:hypothetical protein
MPEGMPVLVDEDLLLTTLLTRGHLLDARSRRCPGTKKPGRHRPASIQDSAERAFQHPSIW